jgi:ATP-binding cassette, subfamily B, bacterial IrtA/YbtP
VWLLTINPWMTLVTLAIVAIAFSILMLGTRRSRMYLARTTAAASSLGRGLVDLVDGLLTFAVFDRSASVPPSLDRSIDDVADSNAEWLGRFAPFGTAYGVLIAAPALLLVPVGGAMVVAERASSDDLLLFLVIGLGYGAPIVRLRRIWFQLNSITFASGVIDGVLRAEAQPEPDVSLPMAEPSIEFDRVSFAYDETPTLVDVSLTVAPGSLTALVGPSGSGKSTIARLIGRFWDVDDGAVRLGGVDVRDRRIDDLLADVTFVFQDTFLFRDSIAANLRVARPDATDDDVIVAAQAANADEFVRLLPDGYDTVIGAGGVRLSGGQRQRLAIARALLHDTPIVVLDEATAFVDPDSEAQVRQALRAMTVDRTVIVIAHRLTSVVDADQILVVDGGSITQRGRHHDLVSVDGPYRRLWDDWHAIDRVAR